MSPLRLLACRALALSMISWSAALAQSVGVIAGRVIYRDVAGRTREVTRTGLDTMPALSPDGGRVAFVRRTPGDTVATSLEGNERTELWLVSTDGSGARRLVRGRRSAKPEHALSGIANPAFSPDGRSVYFESDAWVTSGALHAVEVATGVERFICPANGFEVIRRGRYRGLLMVEQHRYGTSDSYDGTWIVSPAGRTVRLVTLENAPDAEARVAAVRAGRAP